MSHLKELRRTSRDSFESDSDSKESRDVRLNSFNSGILRFFDLIDSIVISIRPILRPSVVVDRPGCCFEFYDRSRDSVVGTFEIQRNAVRYQSDRVGP